MLTNSEIYYLHTIETWEQQLNDYRLTNEAKRYKKYLEMGVKLLPDTTKSSLFMLMDRSLFELQSVLFNSSAQKKATDKILQTARVFHNNIFRLEDMNKLTIDQLNLLAQQHIAHYRMLAFSQGALTGSGKSSLLLTDILAALVINLRSIQVIASIYGRPANTPYEIMTVLKVFYAACLPKELQGNAWNELMEELVYKEEFFYKGKEEIVDESNFELLVKQCVKLLFITMYSKSSPLVSMLIGGGTNYHFTRKVTEFAHNYYQKSHLLIKK
ncbi:MAG: EcsC family protein [Bacillus sp. (in: firmicutes)]